MIKANELRDKHKAMLVQRRKQYIENDLEHALSEIEKELIEVAESGLQSEGVYLEFSWLKKHAKTDTVVKRRELCYALDKHGYECELIDDSNKMLVKWTT